jgi:hypothetical protein
VAPAENMVVRVTVPLILLFLAGNSTVIPTIPHLFKFSKSKVSGFPFGCAASDTVTVAADGRRDRNYEVKPVAVAVWARKAPPGRTDSQADYSEPEAGPCSKRGTQAEEAWSRDPSESQPDSESEGGSGLIQISK